MTSQNQETTATAVVSSDSISAAEFSEILERNGYHTASKDVREGRNWRDSTEYVLRDFADPPHYGDGEEAWLRHFVHMLHAPHPETSA